MPTTQGLRGAPAMWQKRPGPFALIVEWLDGLGPGAQMLVHWLTQRVTYACWQRTHCALDIRYAIDSRRLAACVFVKRETFNVRDS